MSAVRATIKYVNESKNTSTGKFSQSIKVALGNGQEVLVWGKGGDYDHLKKGQDVMIEQSADGKFWNFCKDQRPANDGSPAPGAPMSSTPATVTNGQGYTAPASGYDHAAMLQRAKHLTEIYLQIATELTGSLEFRNAQPDVIASATATIFISTRP
jgi:hypothetical protein